MDNVENQWAKNARCAWVLLFQGSSFYCYVSILQMETPMGKKKNLWSMLHGNKKTSIWLNCFWRKKKSDNSEIRLTLLTTSACCLCFARSAFFRSLSFHNFSYFLRCSCTLRTLGSTYGIQCGFYINKYIHTCKCLDESQKGQLLRNNKNRVKKPILKQPRVDFPWIMQY